MMIDKTNSKSNQTLYSLLPYITAGVVFLASVLLWFCLMYGQPTSGFIDTTKAALPWIILGLGTSLAVLLGISIRFAQLTRKHSKTLALVSEDVKKEISERLQVEESKQQLERTLLQGQKLQAIGTLAGGIAHDFNNILYAIMGYVEMAREDLEQDSLVYKNLGKVLEASHRGRDLIARILAFSRRQHQDFKPMELQTTIESILALLRPTIPAGVTIHFDSVKDDYTILGNQTQIHQIIVNIINNAVDSMDSEGIITLKLYRISASDEFLKQIPNAINTNYYRLDIKDTGHGMDQSTMTRVFEPFYTTKEVGKGTGLGLATAHTIAQAHQGEIFVNSTLGHGTIFTLLLPEYIEENTDG